MALTNLYIEQKNYQKALYFINKALQIDDENVIAKNKLVFFINSILNVNEIQDNYLLRLFAINLYF